MGHYCTPVNNDVGDSIKRHDLKRLTGADSIEELSKAAEQHVRDKDWEKWMKHLREWK
jgi:hypothetical protein